MIRPVDNVGGSSADGAIMTAMTTIAWKIPGYHAHELIGHGASGQVWRGVTSRTGEPIALKRLRSADPAVLRAARAEAALLSALDHPHLIRLHDLVPHGADLVLVLELADGGSLAELLRRRGRLSPGETVSAIAPVAAALAYAHERTVVHADVSAANVLFRADGHPLLADLGLARLVGATGPPAATLAYLDPTVAAGGAPGAPSDVFAVAAVALHALTGAPAWLGAAPEQLLTTAATGEIADLERRLAGLPEPLVAVVRRGLSVQPYARGTAAEFALDLRHAVAPVPIELAAGRIDRAEDVAARRVDGAHRPRHAAAPAPARPVSRAGAEPGRPAFTRPDADGSAATGAAALVHTHAVARRIRPSPAPPAGRLGMPAARPLTAWLSIVGALAGLAVLAMLFAGRGRSPAQAAVQSAAGAPAHGTQGPPSVAVSPSVAARATARPSESSAGSASWDEILARLDARRERAFATADATALSGVYPPGVLLAQDRATLTRLVPAECALVGLRTTYASLHVAARADGTVTIRTRATLARATLTCGGVRTTTTAARGPTALTLTLIRGPGGYRIGSIRTG